MQTLLGEVYLRKLAKQGVQFVSITQPLGDDDDPAIGNWLDEETHRTGVASAGSMVLQSFVPAPGSGDWL